ncbi:MAG: HAD family acid phosphatase [Sulfolobales archaeon]
MEICVFDVDGVLFDVSERYNRALSEDPSVGRRFWKIFFSEELLELDKPNPVGVENLRKCLQRGLSVYIVSGRPERLRDATLNQLREIDIDVGRIRLILRDDRDLRKSFAFKLDIVKRLLKKYVIREIHDDDLEFLKRVREVLPSETTLYHYEKDLVRTL